MSVENSVILIGRLTRDPDLKYTDSGKAVANFTLAVDGRGETQFIPVVTWQKIAENVSKYMEKGRQVAVSGRMTIGSWEDDNGTRRKDPKVVANEVKFLDSGGNEGGQEDVAF